MKSHTYYDILGVSRDATLDEITTAKNALAKVYHPDANAHKNIEAATILFLWLNSLIKFFLLAMYQTFIKSNANKPNRICIPK